MAKSKNPKLTPEQRMDAVNSAIDKLEGSVVNLASMFTDMAKDVSSNNDEIGKLFGSLKSPLLETMKELGLSPIKIRETFDVMRDIAKEAEVKYGELPSGKDMLKLMKEGLKASSVTGELPVESLDKLAEKFDSLSKKEMDLTKTIIKETDTLAYELMKPFDKMVGFIEKIPGGKILSEMFGFDQMKKQIKEKISKELMTALSSTAGGFQKLASVGKASFSAIGGAAKAAFAHPVLLAIALIIGALYVAWKQWNKTIEAAKALRDETGLTGQRAKDLSEILSPIAEKYTGIGVNMETLGKSTSGLVNEFKNADILTEDMIANTGILVGTLGVGVESAAKITRLFQTMGVESGEVAYNLQASIADAADLAGVGMGKVFEDMAQSSKEIHTYFRGNVINAAKAAIELRRMGTSIKEAAASAKSMVDFESSITSELEASVLLGRQLDFSAARYYAFMGDIENQQKEVLKQVGSISEFNAMMPFQKEAIAKAAGMEVDQLANMLEQQKLLGQMTYTQKKDYEDAVKQIGQINKKTADSILLDKQKMVMQEKFAKIWEQIIYTFSSVLFPIFDAIYEAVNEVAKALQDWFVSDEGTKMLKELKDAFSEFADMIIDSIPTIIDIVNGLIWYFTFMMKIQTSLWTVTIKLIGFIIKLGKFLFDAIFRPIEAIKTLQGVFKDLGKGFQEAWAIMKATVFQPFIDIFTTIWGWIVKVGEIIGDVLLFPFNLLIDAVTAFWDALSTGWQVIYKTVFQPFIDAVQAIIDAWTDVTGFLSNPFGIFGGETAPATATGGVATKPQVRMVGEAGPEAIIPLDKAGIGDSSGIISKLDDLINKSDASIVTQKLDELIGAIKSMSIVMDHRKVGEVLATNVTHPGMG